MPFEAGEDTARAIPGATMLAIEGMGHDMPRPTWAADRRWDLQPRDARGRLKNHEWTPMATDEHQITRHPTLSMGG